MPLIPIKKITDNPYQPRQRYNNTKELAAAILERKPELPDTLGLIHTPNARLVELDSQGNRVRVLPPDYPPAVEFWIVELAEGHRRLRAFALLAEGWQASEDMQNWSTIQDGDYGQMPINLLELSDQAMDNIAWDENARRENINPVEEARALARTMADFKYTQEQVAKMRGLGRSTVANKVRLLKLPNDMLETVEAGRLPEKTALAYLPALDIKPHQMDQAGTGTKFTTDPHSIHTWGPPPTPNALRKRLLDTTLPTLTADDVRRLVEKMVDACTPWPCEHCGTNCKQTQFMADTKGTRYCKECWENEITEQLYCPDCHIRNFVKSADIENELPHVCSMCGKITPANEMLKELATQQALPAIEPPTQQPKSLANLLINHAVYPCHNCGSKTILIVDNAVSCETCGETWDTIEEYHTDREEMTMVSVPIDGLTNQQLAEFILANGDWQQVTTEQFGCCACRGLFHDPAGVRAWKTGETTYLCTTCFASAGLDCKCPNCGYDDCKIPATTYKNNFGWRCEKCGQVFPARAWAAAIAGDDDVPGNIATPNGTGPAAAPIAAPDGTGNDHKKLCVHCQKRPANVTNEPYCDKCWHTELTTWLKCPHCDATSTIVKTTGSVEIVECWSCKNKATKSEWVSPTALQDDIDLEILRGYLNARFSNITILATIEQLRELDVILDQLAFNRTRAIEIA